MEIRHVTHQELESAMEKLNKNFAGNIKFKKLEFVRKSAKLGEVWRVTLTVKNSRAPGSRVSPSGKRVCAACWHAHGEFFDLLPECAEIVTSGTHGKEIARPGDAWQDRNIGSNWYPMYYSEACDC